MKKEINLGHGERIVGIIPEIAVGPGWRNTLVWVSILKTDGTLREESIQLDEMSDDMRTLFFPAEAMYSALLAALPVKMKK